VGKTVIVPAVVSKDGNFEIGLGYADDHYDDNGYYAHDDGTQDQCKGERGVDAWVNIRSTSGPIPTPAPKADFDLVSDELDPNFLFLNPVWNYSRIHPGQLPDPDQPLQCDRFGRLAAVNSIDNLQSAAPQCSTQVPSVDQWGGCYLMDSPVNGHVNWRPATVEGTITWGGWSEPIADGDYNLWLTPKEPGIRTQHNGKAFEIEFSSAETADHFTKTWWGKLVSDITAGNNNPAAINGKEVIVSGLVGLDCRHDCVTELHPVYVLAVHLSEAEHDDAWAIFARNWGNEGYCSQYQHYLDVRRPFELLLRREGDYQPKMLESSHFYTSQDMVNMPGVFMPRIVKDDRGARVRLYLPQPDSKAIIYGELHLDWGGGQPPVAPSPQAIASTRHEAEPPNDEELIHQQVLGKLSADEQAMLRTNDAEKYETPVTKTGPLTPTGGAAAGISPTSISDDSLRRIEDRRKKCAALKAGPAKSLCTGELNRLTAAQ
jgi:hypothetical protein